MTKNLLLAIVQRITRNKSRNLCHFLSNSIAEHLKLRLVHFEKSYYFSSICQSVIYAMRVNTCRLSSVNFFFHFIDFELRWKHFKMNLQFVHSKVITPKSFLWICFYFSGSSSYPRVKILSYTTHSNVRKRMIK